MLKKLLKYYKMIILVILFIFLFFIILIITSSGNNIVSASRLINIKELENVKEELELNLVGEKNIEAARKVLNLKEYENMPKSINGYKVIGRISIPEIEVEKYILEETSEEALAESVTKICGEVNKTGNLCLAGHNYRDTFGKISSLETGDKINITDTYDRTVTYQVYSIDRVSPYDTTCLSQETNGEREITLVTCTLGAIKRVVVKAIEVYD